MSDDLDGKSYHELMRIVGNRAAEVRWSWHDGITPVLTVRGLQKGDQRTEFTGPDPTALLREAIHFLAPPRG